jgi:hypothetical protein
MFSLHRPAAFAAALAALAATPAAAAGACPDPDALLRGVDPRLAIVRYLADDALEGRMSGSRGERCAADFIAERFRRLGLVPAGDSVWFQNVDIVSVVNPHAAAGVGRNVIARLDGTDAQLRDEVIIIGAHIDHLGLGGFGSLSGGPPAVHNGADDNASGTAALVRVAEHLAGGPPLRRSVLFVAFTGEELGLLGSARFVSAGPVPVERMRAMLNMDMVGRLGDGPLIVYGVDTAVEWRAAVEAAARDAGVDVALRGDGFGPSDHTSFYARDIPVLHFFTNVHSDYHRPTDTWDRIDADGLERVAALVAAVARDAADRTAPLTLVRGAGTPPAPAGDAPRGYGAWLGTIPDFTPVAHGVLLSGVSANSPAEAAGMRAGDIVIALGTHDIADLQALTDALRAHRPGDRVRVRFLRNGAVHEVDLALGRRGG